MMRFYLNFHLIFYGCSSEDLLLGTFTHFGIVSHKITTHCDCSKVESALGQLFKLKGVVHPVGTSVNAAFFEEISNFCFGFTMVVYEKIYFEAYINKQYI